jgi:hypothetical protein
MEADASPLPAIRPLYRRWGHDADTSALGAGTVEAEALGFVAVPTRRSRAKQRLVAKALATVDPVWLQKRSSGRAVVG